MCAARRAGRRAGAAGGQAHRTPSRWPGLPDTPTATLPTPSKVPVTFAARPPGNTCCVSRQGVTANRMPASRKRVVVLRAHQPAEAVVLINLAGRAKHARPGWSWLATTRSLKSKSLVTTLPLPSRKLRRLSCTSKVLVCPQAVGEHGSHGDSGHRMRRP